MNFVEMAAAILAPTALLGYGTRGRGKMLDRLLFKVNGPALRTCINRKCDDLYKAHAELLNELAEAQKKDEADMKKMAEAGAPDVKPWLTHAGQTSSAIEANRAEVSRLRLIERNVATDEQYSLTVGDLEYLDL